MSISNVVPLAVGNALRVFLRPAAGAILWRVLRKETDDIASESDPAARRIYEGDDTSALDSSLLVNGVTYFYRAFYWNGTAWSGSASVGAAPVASYADASTDVLSVVRDRLDYGLQVEVARGALAPESGGIAVLNAPPVFEDTRWPVVTVHLQDEASFARGIGEMIESDQFDALEGDWQGTEGWLAKVQLTICGWSQNPDERVELRKALRRIVAANLPVFDEHGIVNIDFRQQDMDSLGGEYPTNVYQSLCTFTCVAPVRVVSRGDAIADVTSTIVEG